MLAYTVSVAFYLGGMCCFVVALWIDWHNLGGAENLPDPLRASWPMAALGMLTCVLFWPCAMAYLLWKAQARHAEQKEVEAVRARFSRLEVEPWDLSATPVSDASVEAARARVGGLVAALEHEAVAMQKLGSTLTRHGAPEAADALNCAAASIRTSGEVILSLATELELERRRWASR